MSVASSAIINFDRLQHLIRDDSISYKEEFYEQFVLYRAYYQILIHNPQHYISGITKLILFLSNVIHRYEEFLDEFKNNILSLLTNCPEVKNSSLLLTLVKSMVIMKNNKAASIYEMIELFIKLFLIRNKTLKKIIYNQLIINICKNSRNLNSLNSSVQSFFYKQLSDEDSLNQYLATEISIELYKKNIWRNWKSVLFIQNAIFSKIKKISVNAVQFFIHPVYEDAEDASEDSSDEEEDDFSDFRNPKRRKKLSNTTNSMCSSACSQSFYAIELIRDPFDFTSKLMKHIETKGDSFDYLLDKISLVGLLIWSHKLIIPQYYTFIQRYLSPHQLKVTRILTYLSQGTHEGIPPNFLEPPIEAIISNFISDRNSPETVTVGLNTIREIALKCPHIMTSEKLSDLVQYRKSKNKNVVMAARSLQQLYRNIDPDLLMNKDRGKPIYCRIIQEELKHISGQSNDFIPDVIFLKNNVTGLGGEAKGDIFSEHGVELARKLSQSHIFTQNDYQDMKRKKMDHLLNPKLSNQQLYLNYRIMKDKRRILSVSDIEHFYTKPKYIQMENGVDKSENRKKAIISGLNKKKMCRRKNYMMVCHGKSVIDKKITTPKKSYQGKNKKLKRILKKEYRRLHLADN